MKKSTIEKIDKEISEKTKLPNEIKEKIKKEVFTNIIIASIIILYFILIVLGSANSIKSVRTTDLNIFSLLFLGGAIFLFEIAYRKDDGKLAMYGIESLAIAIFMLFLPYIIFELNESNKKYYLMASAYIAGYYILKSIIIAIKTKNKYMNENISDVKEIVKKEKTRRIKEDIEESEIKDEKNKNSVVKNNEVKEKVEITPKESKKKEQTKNTNQKQGTTPKKRGRPKKTETTNNENKEILKDEPQENTQPKKRGRPKKTETITKQENKIETTPKKRGRPRKVAVKND